MYNLGILICAVVAGTVQAQDATNSRLQLSWTRPSNAVPLPPDLCGLSVEPDRWPDWAGNVTHRNEFTYRLLNTLKQKTGVAPRIRVGGGTQDRIFYTPTITGNPGFHDVFPQVPAQISNTKQLFPEADTVYAGPNYWLSSCNLPEGTAFTWGVNFWTGNISEAVAQVRQIERTFTVRLKLDNIEFGNEADTWASRARPGNWSIWDYTKEQIQYFHAVNKALGENGRKYRIADWAIDWTSEQLLATGIMESPMGRSINTISEHHYQSGTKYSLSPSDWPTIATQLTNKANIRSNLAPYAISAFNAQKSGIDFFLGETNTFSGHGQPGVSNSAAAALWMIDYCLQAASVGIKGLQFHQGVGYNYSAFEPVDNIGMNITDFSPSAKRHVLPLYYAYLAVADAIGNSGNAYINELWTDNSSLAAYQIWEGKTLKRIMLINEVPWTQIFSSQGTRPTMAINLPDLAGRAHATYKRLEFPSLSAYSGLTWGGQSWESYSGMPIGHETLEKLASDGTIMMSASSAALIYL
ncbi:glycoside hydrolase family 79 protein [Xylogone sp. PMI_703]|nr:glycoside hydrolase family 79 protein [Xylogone sp. PMI_703]